MFDLSSVGGANGLSREEEALPVCPENLLQSKRKVLSAT